MRTKRAVVALSVAAVVGLTPVAAFARHGADDPKGHHAREDRARVTRVGDRRRHVEPGDDRGRGRHIEPGDDNGGHHGGEAGDDHGDR